MACSKCGYKRTSLWCNDCERRSFKLSFSTWTSGSELVDKFIQDIQINAQSCTQYIEWIPFDRLTIINYVASGGSARTFLANWKDGPMWKFDKKTGKRVRSGSRNVIVKQIKNGVELTSEYLNELKSYFKCVSWDDHLLHYFGITRDPSTKEYAVVVEYAKLGSLRDYLYKDTNLTWSRRLSILNEIALGLYNIHAKNVIHGDIHSGNVLVYDSKKSRKGNDDVYTVIADLRLSRSILRSSFSLDEVYGILPYIAPEILVGGDQTISSDIYSFGHIMYVLSTGRQPFADYLYDKNRLAFSICGGLRPNIPADTPADYAILMRQCWDAEPSRRPDAFDLVTRIGTIRRTLPADEVAKRLVRKGRTSRVDEIDDGCKSSWVDVSTLRGTITLRASNSLTNIYALNGGSFARHSESSASLRSQYRRATRAPNGNKSVTSDINSQKSDSVTIETLVASHEKSESEDTTAMTSTAATTPTRQQMVTFLEDSKTDIRKDETRIKRKEARTNVSVLRLMRRYKNKLLKGLRTIFICGNKDRL